MNDMLSVNEVAKELNVTTRTIRNYLSEGKLKGVKVGGQWRFPKSELQKFFGESVNHSIIDFIENDDINNFEGIVILTAPILGEQKVEKLKSSIINQYNNVYNGNGRKFSYQKKSDNKILITLEGPHEYIFNFGNWISNELINYKNS